MPKQDHTRFAGLAEAITNLGDSGSPAAWAFIIDHCHKNYTGLAQSIAGPHLVADALQEAALRIRASAQQFRGMHEAEPAARLWLQRIITNSARNVIRNEGRRQKRQRQLPDLDCFANEEPGASHEISHQQQLIVRVFAEIPEADRELLQRHLIEHMHYRDLAELYHCSVATIRRRHSRAMQRFRQALRQHGLSLPMALGLLCSLPKTSAACPASHSLSAVTTTGGNIGLSAIGWLATAACLILGVMLNVVPVGPTELHQQAQRPPNTRSSQWHSAWSMSGTFSDCGAATIHAEQAWILDRSQHCVWAIPLHQNGQRNTAAQAERYQLGRKLSAGAHSLTVHLDHHQNPQFWWLSSTEDQHSLHSWQPHSNHYTSHVLHDVLPADRLIGLSCHHGTLTVAWQAAGEQTPILIQDPVSGAIHRQITAAPDSIWLHWSSAGLLTATQQELVFHDREDATRVSSSANRSWSIPTAIGQLLAFSKLGTANQTSIAAVGPGRIAVMTWHQIHKSLDVQILNTAYQTGHP